MKGLIFITGLRKSGTSMTKALLDGHPEVFMFPANEFELFHYTQHRAVAAAKYRRETDIRAIQEALATNDYIVRLNRKTTGADDYRTNVDIEGFQRELLQARVETIPQLIEAAFTAMARHCNYWKGDLATKYCAAKCVLNSEYVPEILNWFPDAKIVYVLRNPYGHFDSIRTVSRRANRSRPRYEGMKRSPIWNTYPVLGIEMRRMTMSYYFMRKWRALYPENFYVLVYDRVLEDPQREMTKLAGFLNIAFQPSLLTPTIAGIPTKGNSSKGKEFAGIDKSPLTHWKSTISRLEIRLINEYFGDVIDEFGFERLPSSAPLWWPFQIYERPLTYLVNRLLFKTRSWFTEIEEDQFARRQPPTARPAEPAAVERAA